MNPLVSKWMSSASFAPDGPAGGGSSSPAAIPASSVNTGSGGGSAPASAPSPAPAGGASSPQDADNSSDDFSGFDSVDDLDGGDGETGSDSGSDVTIAPKEPVVDPTKPAVAPPATPAEPTPPQTPAATPSEAPAAAPSAVDGLLQNLQTNEGPLQQWLAENSYKLSAEDVAAFETDAIGQIPKLLAKVQVASMKSALNLIKQLVPEMIDTRVATTTTASAKAKEAVEEFYSTNTDLNQKDHQPLMEKWAKAFRASNPKASRADAIKFVGQAIRTELGLPPLGAKPAIAKPQPFAPARPGTRVAAAPVAEASPFAGLGMDFED